MNRCILLTTVDILCFVLGMSTLERKKDVFQEFKEKFLKTYLVCIYFSVIQQT